MVQVVDRRTLVRGGLAAAGVLAAPAVRAAAAPLKVGLMLPYSGTFAQLGENITAGIELYLGERGGSLGKHDATEPVSRRGIEQDNAKLEPGFGGAIDFHVARWR